MAQTVSIGQAGAERRLVNLADGIGATDAVTRRQLDSAVAGLSPDISGGALRTSDTAGRGAAMASGSDSLAVGNGARAGASGSAAFGQGAAATAQNSLALGNDAVAAQTGAIALGRGVATSRADQIAIGTAGATYTRAGIGSAASRAAQAGPVQVVTADAGGNLATASLDLAQGAATTTADATALGLSARADGTNAVAFGRDATASAEGSVALGAGSVASEARTVSIGSAGAGRRIVNLADGVNASDAASVGQVTSAVAQLTVAVTARLDGMPIRSGDAAGAAAPVAEGQHALAIGFGSATNAAEASAIGTGARATAARAVAIGAGSVADQADTVSVGTRDRQRRIVNVAPARDGTDAVNLDQMQSAIAESSAQVNARIDGLAQAVVSLRRESRRGIAATAALASPSMPSAPGRTTLSANVSTFKGEYAIGVGFAHRLDTRLPVIIHGGYANGGGAEHVGRAGIMVEF